MDESNVKESEEKVTVYEMVDHGNSVCEHVYEYTESDPRSNLTSVMCTKCFHGASIDGTKYGITEGKIVSREDS